MDAVSQRTRSKRVQDTEEQLEIKETEDTQEKTEYEAEVTEIVDEENTEDAEDTRWDHEVRDSLDDRMDNYVGAMLYTAIHYPRFFAALWVLVLVTLSVLAVSTQKLPA